MTDEHNEKHGLIGVVIPYSGDLLSLDQCLKSIEAQIRKPERPVLIDNGTGHRLTEVAADIVRNPTNLGFSVAVNQGIAKCVANKYVMVLNQDANLEPTYIGCCIDALERHPDWGAITGKLLKTDDRTLDTTGHVLYSDRRTKDRGEFEIDEGQCDLEEEVFSVPATAAIYRRAALEEIGRVTDEVFDANFFAYGEDVDVAWRMRLMGWKVGYCPEARGHHLRAVSGRKTPSRVLVWDLRNRYLRMLKNDSLKSALRSIGSILLTECRLFIFLMIFRPLVVPRAIAGFLVRVPSTIRKRKRIQSSRTVDPGALEFWFHKPEKRYWSLRGINMKQTLVPQHSRKN